MEKIKTHLNEDFYNHLIDENIKFINNEIELALRAWFIHTKINKPFYSKQ